MFMSRLAEAFNFCYISALLGGPISGNKIRKMHETV